MDVVESTHKRWPGEKGSHNGYHSANTLDEYRRDALLSRGELWLRYFELGGMSTAFEMEAFLLGRSNQAAMTATSSPMPSTNALLSIGGNHPVPYAEDSDDDLAK